MRKTYLLVFMAVFLFQASGCALFSKNLKGRYKAEGPVENWTGSSKELLALPKPSQSILVSVWKMPDETGQHKRSQNATELSKAVTQGAVHMLIKALRDSGWFIVAEREAWNNLAQELRIREEMRKQNIPGVTGMTQLKLPRYMVTGAITEFENQPLSGGGGAAYRGYGFSVRAKVAHVAVDLRLTDIETGVVLDAVSIYKRIVSEEVDFNIFRFLKINHLLEVEVGYTANEPTQTCVREAIEKAVIQLILNGSMKGLWKMAREEDLPSLMRYRERKESREGTDVRQPYTKQKILDALESTIMAIDAEKELRKRLQEAGYSDNDTKDMVRKLRQQIYGTE